MINSQEPSASINFAWLLALPPAGTVFGVVAAEFVLDGVLAKFAVYWNQLTRDLWVYFAGLFSFDITPFLSLLDLLTASVFIFAAVILFSRHAQQEPFNSDFFRTRILEPFRAGTTLRRLSVLWPVVTWSAIVFSIFSINAAYEYFLAERGGAGEANILLFQKLILFIFLLLYSIACFYVMFLCIMRIYIGFENLLSWSIRKRYSFLQLARRMLLPVIISSFFISGILISTLVGLIGMSPTVELRVIVIIGVLIIVTSCVALINIDAGTSRVWSAFSGIVYYTIALLMTVLLSFPFFWASMAEFSPSEMNAAFGTVLALATVLIITMFCAVLQSDWRLFKRIIILSVALVVLDQSSALMEVWIQGARP